MIGCWSKSSSEVLAVIQRQVIYKALKAVPGLVMLMLDGPNGLADNGPDLLHCLVAGVVVRPQPQALLVHAHHRRRQPLAVPACTASSAGPERE